MHPVDPEDLLRRLAEIEEERSGDLPGDDTLRAFAAGELGEEEERRTAAALAGNPAARERLAGIVGVLLPEPGEATRRKVLAAAAGREGPRPARHRLSRHRLGWSLAAAAVLAAALAWPLFENRLPPARSPLGDVYEARIEGLKRERSAAGESRTVAEAGPDTRVVVRISRDGLTDPDPRFSLYRQAGDRLERLPVAFAVHPRVAVAEAPARDLGAGAGRQWLFAVVSQPGDEPPQRLTLAAGQSPEAALGGLPTRRVFRLSVVPPVNFQLQEVSPR